MQLSLQGILKGGKNKSKPVSTSQTPLCMPERRYTRIPQLSQSYLRILLQVELQVTGTCIDTPSSWWSIVISQRWLWDISTLEKMIRNAWGDLSTITNTEVVKSEWTLSTQPRLPLRHAQKPLERWTWRHFAPFQKWNVSWTSRYMLQGSLRQHPWLEGKGLGHTLSSGPPKYTVYPLIHPVCSS